MKIDENFIKDIFNLKIKLKNKKDKIKLSKYEDSIPMYDIYTQTINIIDKTNIYTYLLNYHFRFVNNEVKQWIKELYEKNIKKLKKDANNEYIKIIVDRLKTIIMIIDNYDIDTLTETSQRVLYKYSKNFGLSISICKRNSFTPYISYLTPYYTKNEIVKLGQNMKLLPSNFNIYDILSEEKHHKICKYISNNDISIEQIMKHTNYIINKNIISDVIFYSFIGSSLTNKYLRNQSNIKINKFYYDRIINIANNIKNAPSVDNDFYLYRLISDDSFISNLKIGDIFTDQAFISTTRDPFYSPGVEGTFGFILIKIKFKKNTPGLGLFIEHFSLFPKEEEVIIAPYSKLKLISKDDKFKYYHVNKYFEKSIVKKYEFEYVGVDYKWIKNLEISDESIPNFNIEDFNFDTRINGFKNFVKLNTNYFNQINLFGRIFYCFFFDSRGAYKHLYYNTTKNGLSLIEYDENGYINLMIEMGDEMAVNYINKFYYYNTKSNKVNNETLNLLFNIAKLFKYNKVKIFNNYENFTKFKSNYYNHQLDFLYINMYDDDLYNYLKFNKKPFDNPYITDFTRDIDTFLSKYSKEEALKIKEYIIYIIENEFTSVNNEINKLELENFNFSIFNVNKRLIDSNEEPIPDINDADDIDNDNFRTIFRENRRRFD